MFDATMVARPATLGVKMTVTGLVLPALSEIVELGEKLPAMPDCASVIVPPGHQPSVGAKDNVNAEARPPEAALGVIE